MKNSCPEKAVTSVACNTQISEFLHAPTCTGVSTEALQMLFWPNDNAVRQLLVRVKSLLGGADEEEGGCFGLEYVSSIDSLCRHGHSTLVCLLIRHRQSHQCWLVLELLHSAGVAEVTQRDEQLFGWTQLPLGATCTLLGEISPADPHCLYLIVRFQIKIVL